MKQIEANNYTIEIGNLVESSFQTLLQTKYASSKKVILVDENTHDYCLEYLLTNFEELTDAEVMLLPVGEENKVMAVCFQVFEALSEYQIGRNDVIINLGGGLVSDMGGFVASIYKRGIDCINIPTSLLAMVDASIGGKTGIDLGPYKNQIGTFTDPKSLFIDISFLETLPEEEIMNGYAEMLKHALILDKSYWNELTTLDSLDDLLDENLIIRSIALKNEVVKADPFEKNNRKKLNFGHTAGHALEGFFLDSTPISHGHAVGIGMIAETFISYKKGILTKKEWELIEEVLLKIFPIVNFQKDDIPTLIQLMKNDKKNFDGAVKCCLLSSIGECVIDQDISEDEIKEMFYYLIAMLN
jgi:3-dehydroquinate synthase